MSKLLTETKYTPLSKRRYYSGYLVDKNDNICNFFYCEEERVENKSIGNMTLTNTKNASIILDWILKFSETPTGREIDKSESLDVYLIGNLPLPCTLKDEHLIECWPSSIEYIDNGFNKKPDINLVLHFKETKEVSQKEELNLNLFEVSKNIEDTKQAIKEAKEELKNLEIINKQYKEEYESLLKKMKEV